MCLNPRTIGGGQLVACRECWQCKEQRVADWVGRCIAESKTSAEAYLVTLTYGQDTAYAVTDVRAKQLDYSDVQGWLKRVRKVAPCRFFAAGEYGSQKGRAHWHVILFFPEVTPAELNIRLGVRYLHETKSSNMLWPHGFSYWDLADVRGIRYATKYVTKEGLEDRGLYGMSTKPALGSAYFFERAKRYVEQGLSPQDFMYSFAEVKRNNGALYEFWLRGALCYQFLHSFAELWRSAYGDEGWPQSELMDDFVDERFRRDGRPNPAGDRVELWDRARFGLERKERSEWPVGSIAGEVSRIVDASDYKRRFKDGIETAREK